MALKSFAQSDKVQSCTLLRLSIVQSMLTLVTLLSNSPTLNSGDAPHTVCAQAFRANIACICLQDGNNEIDEKELHICLLILYDKLNDKLPCHIRVPRSEEVHELYMRHTPAPGASLNEQQFLAVAGDLFASTEKWWDSVLVKVVVTAGLQLALFPLAGAHTCTRPTMTCKRTKRF